MRGRVTHLIAAPAAVTLAMTVAMPLAARVSLAVAAAAPAIGMALTPAPAPLVHRKLARATLRSGRRARGIGDVLTVTMAHDHLLGIAADHGRSYSCPHDVDRLTSH